MQHLDGINAAKKAEDKNKKHKRAVEDAHHVFLPFAMEVYGHFDASARRVVKRLAKERPDYLAYEFMQEMFHDASTALAAGVATSLIQAHNKFSSCDKIY